jgi:hypothetical protein
MNAEDETLFPVAHDIQNKQKPKIYVNNKQVDYQTDKSNLRGKTLEVYDYLISNPGDHGVREIQRVLNYSSPSVVTYHLNRLIDAKIVTKNAENRYLVITDEIKLGSLANHIRIIRFWVPRSILYAITTLFLVLTGIMLVIVKMDNYQIWAIFFLPPLTLITVLLFYDSYKLSKKLVDASK